MCVVVACAAPTAAAAPRPGSFDRSFAGDGKRVFDLPGEGLRPGAVAVQADGKIVVAGQLHEPGTPSGRALLIRFLEDGRLDTTFASGGVARATLPRPVTIGTVTIDPAGGFLLGGSANVENGYAGALVRLMPDGSVDEAFGDGGLVTVDPDTLRGDHLAAFTHLAVQGDGRIVAAGPEYSGWPHEVAFTFVARLLEDGRLDQSFGDGGVAFDSANFPGALVLGGDGQITVLGGDDQFFGGSELYALRFGSQPAHRGYPFARSLSVRAAELQHDGSIVVIAELTGGRLAWVRLGPDLQLLERRVLRSEGVAVAAFDARGAVLTAGKSAGNSASPFGIQRFRDPPNGPDRSFGRNGASFVGVGDPGGLIGAMVTDDKLLLAGATGTAADWDHRLTLIRLHANQDTSGPIVSVRGLPRRGCVGGVIRPLVRTRDVSSVRVHVTLDRRLIARTRRPRIRVPIDTAALAAGPHKLVVSARDAAGNLGRHGATFRVCGAASASARRSGRALRRRPCARHRSSGAPDAVRWSPMRSHASHKIARVRLSPGRKCG